ncbi:MAG: hypothetical protein ABIJ09_02745 [Pseudomonadota bacterium]
MDTDDTQKIGYALTLISLALCMQEDGGEKDERKVDIDNLNKLGQSLLHDSEPLTPRRALELEELIDHHIAIVDPEGTRVPRFQGSITHPGAFYLKLPEATS